MGVKREDKAAVMSQMPLSPQNFPENIDLVFKHDISIYFS